MPITLYPFLGAANVRRWNRSHALCRPVRSHPQVYDLTDFVEEHPGGPESVTAIAGKDGTASFDAVHSKAMLADFTPLGPLVG